MDALKKFPMLHRIHAETAVYPDEWKEGLESGDKMLALLNDGLQKAHEMKQDKVDPAVLQQIEQKLGSLTAIYTELERILRQLVGPDIA